MVSASPRRWSGHPAQILTRSRAEPRARNKLRGGGIEAWPSPFSRPRGVTGARTSRAEPSVHGLATVSPDALDSRNSTPAWRCRREPILRLVHRFAAVKAHTCEILRRMVTPSCPEWPAGGHQVSSRAPTRPLGGLIWPRVGCASITFPQRRAIDFLPLRWAHSSRGKKVSGPPSSAALRPQTVRVDRPPASRSPSRPRWARPGSDKETYDGDHRHLHQERR
jgi:hypothetical protein